jgi:hypothetical protein
MKNLVQYLKLWQKKRVELPIETDADADWMEMRALLDKQMPGGDYNGSGSKPGGIRLLPTILIFLSAAAMIYFTAKVVQTKPKADQTKNEIQKRNRGFNSGYDSSAGTGLQQSGQDSASNTSGLANADNPKSRDAFSNKSAKLNSLPNSNSGKKEHSDAVDKTNGNLSADRSGKLQPGQATASNVKESSSIENKTGKKVSSNNPDKQESGTDPAENASRYADAEIKTGSKLSASNKKVSGSINSGAANASLSNAAAIKKTPNGKRNSVGANKGLAQSTDGTSVGDRTIGGRRQSTPKENLRARKPGSLLNAESGDDLSAANSINPAINTRPYLAESNQELFLLPDPKQSIFAGSNEISNYPIDKIAIKKAPVSTVKTQKNKSTHPNGSFEWGVLIGANPNGSFTAKNLNHNFYGSLPVDVFTGAYGIYHLSSKWGIGTQVAILTPTMVKGGTYTDSLNKTSSRVVSDSKKVYSVQFPLYATYQFTKTIGFNAGPVISFPVKQFNTDAQVDSLPSSIITQSRYDQKPDYSFMGGINLRYKWIIFETSYLKGLTRHSITSGSFIDKSINNTFQFTIKLRLGTVRE